ncbi:MAG: PEP-CTERM sorting domain-containing protein [Verrucomicrobiota bacterium]
MPVLTALFASALSGQVDIISTSPSVNLDGINSQGTGIYQDLRNNGLPENNVLYLFVEQQNVTLGSNLVVGEIQDGVAYDQGNKPSNTTIAAGTTVSSIFLHYNRNSGSGELTGQFEFNREVLGLSWASGTGNASLVQSDFMGIPGTLFQSNGGNARGVFENFDTITVNGSTVDFALRMSSNFIDQFRLILNATPYFYWDLNGSTPGAGGATPNGTWNNTNTFWSTAIEGDISTSIFAFDSIAVFSAGDDATGTYSIEKDDTESINGLNFQDGNVSIVDNSGTKGVLNLNTVDGVNPGINVNDGATGTIQIEINDGGNGIRKTGTGTLEFGDTPVGSTMSISGELDIQVGTVNLNNSNNTDYITGNVSINSGTTLILSADNQMAASSNMTIDGGTFQVDNASDTLGTLTLSDDSVIDFSGSNADVRFADSSSESWGSSTLTISDWDGRLVGGGNEQLFFGNSASGLNGSQIQNVFFENPMGLPAGTYGARILTTGEVVPVVPEPSTYLFGASLVGFLAYFHLRRRRKPKATLQS